MLWTTLLFGKRSAQKEIENPAEPSFSTLDQIRPGREVIVMRIIAGQSATRQLAQLGIRPGVTLTVQRTAPLGGRSGRLRRNHGGYRARYGTQGGRTNHRMKIALVGQPNCGKSTIFNSVAGYRAATGNFPGTTVRLAWSRVRLNGMLADLVDLPGIYSLTPTNPAETAGRKFLLHEDVSLIINVVDASLLSRSLELTLDLRELGIPMVVCLNMMDEAERRGIKISSQKLSEFLALPVVETIGSRGVGVKQLFREAQRQVHQPPRPASLVAWNHDIERSIRRMQDFLDADSSAQRLPSRFLAIKLLENDEEITREAGIAARNEASRLREQIEQTHGRPAESVIMSERHDCAMRLFNNSATLTRPRPDPRAALDNLLTHRKWGYIFLAAILVGFFWAVFGIGSLIERAIA